MKKASWTMFWLMLSFTFCSFAIAEENAQTPEGVTAEPAQKEAPAAPSAEDQALAKAWELIQKGKAAMGSTKDYTAIFYKQEYVGGKMFPQEKVFQKFRVKPRSVYMKWIGKEHKGQETLWNKGKNDNKIKAYPGWGLSWNLDPKGSLAMKGNRHPIMDAGMPHTIDLIAKDFQRLKNNPDHQSSVKYLGESVVYGAKSACFEATLDKAKDKQYYAYKAHICMDLKNRLPNQIKIWDKEGGKVRLVESYGYENIRRNVGLTDKDFDEDNDEYGF